MFLNSLLACSLLELGYLTYAVPVESSNRVRQNECARSDVLILGAGMAGASAGKALSKAGVHDFNIIEYQDHVGGRTLHTKFGTKPNGSPWTVELGTNWITGLHRPSRRDKGIVNPVWTLAQEVNLTTVSDDTGGSMWFDQSGEYDWSDSLGELSRASGRAGHAANQRVKNGKQDVSVRVGWGLAGWDSVNDPYKIAAEALQWDLDAATTPDVSSLIFSTIETEASEGYPLGGYERFVLDQRGYDTVTQHLASEYLKPNDTRLVLSSPVTKVNCSTNGVTVSTANGTCYEAKYAICTFSLGVLQQAINGKTPVSFSPVFPEWKAESVFGNVMGTYTKIFYQFKQEDIFWNKSITEFNYASPSDRGYWVTWESLDFKGSPLEGSGIIFATMAYQQSARIEQLSNDDVMQEGLAVLRQMFPNTTISEPEDFVFQRWGKTPWIYGSYTNWANGYPLEQHTNFRANLEGLWFAGEATSDEFFGYLHGAYYEGQFAGEEVAACVKGQRDCSARVRYPDLKGDPESWYNHTAGFQNPIDKVVSNY